MKKRVQIFGWLAAAISVCSLPAQAADGPQMAERHRALFQSYCVKCHNAEKQEGKFRVDNLAFTLSDLPTAERWQKVLNALNSGEMPPADEKQPQKQEKADFLDDLSNVMVAARKSLSDQRGQITMRRLNRREYRNTLHVLLGVEANVSELPADTGAGGYDTVGANLFMSGNQFEQYLALGREALDEAFARQLNAKVEKYYRYEAEESLPAIIKLVEGEAEARQRALAWVKAVEEAAARPENSAIVAEIKKTATTDVLFRRQWSKIAGAPSPEKYGFVTAETPADKANRALGTYFTPYKEYYLKQPALDRGAYLTIQQGDDLNSWIKFLVPFNWPVGDYVVRVRVGATEHATPERRFLEFGVHPRHGRVYSVHEVTGTIENPQVIEIPLTLTNKHADRDNRTLFVREKGTADHIDQTRKRFNDGMKKNNVGPDFALWVDWMEIERKTSSETSPPGIAALDIPLDDRSTAPAPDALRAALQRFSVEAFRGTVPPAPFVDRLVRLYETRRKAGAKHSDALKDTLSVVLASPMFLYLSEQSENEKRRTLSDHELASRLSYFLWGAPPDVTLRDLAARGELSRPGTLAAQVERMLDDPRSLGFSRAFVYQWLDLDRLDFFEINRSLYPRFDDATKLLAREEVYATFEFLLRNNASLSHLLKSDYVVINSLLANYYQIDGVRGDAFQKVPVANDSPRGGLMGMAAINVMGGNGERTSPVERGAWVLRKLLNDPPPPAPANVPQIARLAGQLLTTRERLLAHQEDPQCTSCHRKIDPIGFGLENFDAAGQWRTEDRYGIVDAKGRLDPKQTKTWTIDPSAAFHKGPAFKNFFEMRDIIASKSEDFARGYTADLIEFALGRPCGLSDQTLVDTIVSRAKSKDFAMREFVLALVSSEEFHTK